MTAGAHQAKSDFFERLIDKALGTDAGIAPRLPSLFEAAPQATPGSISLDEPEHDTPDAGAPADRSPQAPSLRPPRMMERDRGTPRDIAGQPAGNEPAPATPPHGTVFVDAPIDGDSPEPAVPRAVLPLAAPDMGATVDDAPPPRAVTAAPLASRAPTSSPVARGRRRAASAHGEAEADEAPTAPQLVPDARVTIERVFATPARAAHRRQSDDRHAEPSELPAAPSVNITIGRVEVRAVSAPVAKPRAEPRGRQPLGLDEYLKRRGAG